ncbi:MAG: aspartate aminotransferase family protein [Candidatus Rokubacteria bacterium]|nr:aspartate aminotransferase family protein [Candidatus Rokubacteria bacterium]
MATVNAADLIKDDQSHLIHPLHHASEAAEPLVVVEGRGVVIRDIQGREYIDGLSGLWNVSVGHGREELARAAFEQMKKLAYFSNYVGCSNVPAVTLATKVANLAYRNLTAVFFTCGGAEANESAFKTARFYWKAKGKPDKVKIIARQNAYHGVTLQAMSATGMAPYWKMFEPRVPGFLHIQAPYPYRFQGAKPGESVGQAAARELEEAILREGPDTVAAFIAEPIIGGGGVIVPPDDYFPRVREICTRHQVLFISDEVITGFCRTGHWFALTHWGVEPDIMSFAKAVTSGYQPLGGIAVSQEIHDVMNSVPLDSRWMHAYTYSGHPTCCAVGLANLEIMERERLWERAATMGTRLHRGFLGLQKELGAIGDVRGGKGLLAAVELVSDRTTKAGFPADQKVGARVRREMEKRGLVTRTRSLPVGGTVAEQIFLAPPLVVTEQQVDRIVEIVREAILAVVPGRA